MDPSAEKTPPKWLRNVRCVGCDTVDTTDPVDSLTRMHADCVASYIADRKRKRDTPLGHLCEISVGTDDNDGPVDVMCWFPNDIRSHDRGDRKRGKPFPLGPTKLTYHDILEDTGYSWIQHILSLAVPDDREMDGVFELNREWHDVPLDDPRIELVFHDPLAKPVGYENRLVKPKTDDAEAASSAKFVRPDKKAKADGGAAAAAPAVAKQAAEPTDKRGLDIEDLGLKIRQRYWRAPGPFTDVEAMIVFPEMQCPSILVDVGLGRTLINRIATDVRNELRFKWGNEIPPYTVYREACNALAAPYFHRVKAAQYPAT